MDIQGDNESQNEDMEIRMRERQGYITVIVPVYNVEKYLDRCMESILAQTYTKLEIILVDDGAADSSGAICDSYAQKDERVQVIHKENGGLSSARNAALDIAQGEYIGFVDSDDYISVDMFEKLYQACVQYESEIAICCHYTERGDRLLIEEPIVDESIQYTGVEALELLIRDQGIRNYAWDKLYKASLFQSIRYPDGRNYEDIATTYLLFYRAKRICSIPRYLYYYQIREGSISSHVEDTKWLENCYQIIVSQTERYHFMKEHKEERLADLCLAQLVPYLYEYIRLGLRLHTSLHRTEVLTLLNKEWENIQNNSFLSAKDRRLYKIYTAAPIVVQSYQRTKEAVKKVQDCRYKLKNALGEAGILSVDRFDFQLAKGKERRIIFFELPCSDNLGDHAIAYAQKKYLEALTAQRPEYQLYTIDGWDTVEAVIQLTKEIGKKDVIVCQGGGNMGSLYEFAEAFRQKLLKAFVDNRIIIFPQTIYFSQDEQGERTKRKMVKVYNKCKRLTICARDAVSAQTMQSMFTADIESVNDIVAYLSGRIPVQTQRKGIVLCLRSDLESALTTVEKKVLRQACTEKASDVRITDTCLGRDIDRQDREAMLMKKWSVFAGVQLVVTDRLHGMIFSLIMGTPCIVLGNNHHKVKATYATFKDCKYLQYAENVREAVQMIAAWKPDEIPVTPYNTEEYYKKLEQLDYEFREVVENGNTKHVVFADRFSLKYLFDDIGLVYSATYPVCTKYQAPKKQTVSYLEKRIREEKLPVIFKNEIAPSGSAEKIAKKTGAAVEVFNTCHTVTRKQFEEGVSYIELMNSNVDKLKKALK